MRISDWSSDVCSSDLTGAALGKAAPAGIGRGAAEIEKLVEAERVEAVRRNLGARPEDDEGLDRCEIGGKGLGKVDEARVDEQDAVPGLVRDPGQLVAREARIERVRVRTSTRLNSSP